jgi:NADH-quinone oxidoreductase subunit M
MTDFILNHILTLILFVPTLVAVVLFFLPRQEKILLRWTAFLGSLIPLILAIILWLNFQAGARGFQVEVQQKW